MAVEGIEALEEDAKAKTLGQLIASLRKAITVPPCFDDELRTFLANRNRFIHYGLLDPEFDTDHSEGERNLWSFLIRFCNQMHAMNLIFLGFLGTFYVDIGVKVKGTPWGDFFEEIEESSPWKLVIKRTPE